MKKFLQEILERKKAAASVDFLFLLSFGNNPTHFKLLFSNSLSADASEGFRINSKSKNCQMMNSLHRGKKKTLSKS